MLRCFSNRQVLTVSCGSLSCVVQHAATAEMDRQRYREERRAEGDEKDANEQDAKLDGVSACVLAQVHLRGRPYGFHIPSFVSFVGRAQRF